MDSNYFNSNSNSTNSNENQQTVPTSTINQLLNNPLKRNLKLEISSGMDAMSNPTSGSKAAKRPKLVLPSASSLNLNIPLLSTPDLMKLDLATPDLAKYMMQTPTPTQVLYSTSINEEQEQYTNSFVAALNEIKNNNSNMSLQLKDEMTDETFDMTRCSSNSSSATYTTLDSSSQFPNVNSNMIEFTSSDGSIYIKEELSTSPPMSPINMESQERIKLERKRQRNRVAASKCRKRKLERIARLEERVKILKGENSELAGLASKLKQQVCTLKEQVLEHVQNGCQIMLTSQF